MNKNTKLNLIKEKNNKNLFDIENKHKKLEKDNKIIKDQNEILKQRIKEKEHKESFLEQNDLMKSESLIKSMNLNSNEIIEIEKAEKEKIIKDNKNKNDTELKLSLLMKNENDAELKISSLMKNEKENKKKDLTDVSN